MIIRILILVVLAVIISACSGHIETPHIRGGASIDAPHHHDNSSQRKHCPPGHAKKGWC